MTRVFLTQTPASAAFAEHLRQELRAKGYTVAEYPPLEAVSFSRRIERDIIGSAAVVLLWESNATTSVWEVQHIQFSRRFQKPLFLIVLDTTPPPVALVALPTLSGQLPPATTATALIGLPDFPPSRTSDPLLTLYEEATDAKVKTRRAAIEKAAAMLAQDQHRDEILTLLTYLAEQDQTTILQKEAGKALVADAQRRTPKPPFSPVEAAMMVGGQCERGHVSYYNRREICLKYQQIVYAPASDQHRETELVVPCQASGCSLPVVVHVDCGAYK